MDVSRRCWSLRVCISILVQHGSSWPRVWRPDLSGFCSGSGFQLLTHESLCPLHTSCCLMKMKSRQASAHLPSNPLFWSSCHFTFTQAPRHGRIYTHSHFLFASIFARQSRTHPTKLSIISRAKMLRRHTNARSSRDGETTYAAHRQQNAEDVDTSSELIFLLANAKDQLGTAYRLRERTGKSMQHPV